MLLPFIKQFLWWPYSAGGRSCKREKKQMGLQICPTWSVQYKKSCSIWVFNILL